MGMYSWVCGHALRMVDWNLPDVASLQDVELDKVLLHINRVTKAGRKSAAGQPSTRMYLQAGLRLLARAVSSDPTPGGDPEVHPFLGFLSRRRVVDEVAAEKDRSLPREGSVAALRGVYDPHRGFVIDLLRVALRANEWVRAVADTTVEQVKDIEDRMEVVRQVAIENTQAVADDPGFRVQLLATTVAAQEPELHVPLADMYEVVTESWAALYEEMFRSWGLKLRDGITFQQLADILTALGEGSSLRQAAAPSSRVLDLSDGSSLLGTGAMAVLASCLVSSELREGDEPEQDFESYVERRLQGHRA